MTQAKDIMTTSLVTIGPDSTVHRAVNLLANHDITGIPVVDKENKVLGILSEKDVLCLMREDEGIADRPVSEFMTTPAITFDVSENVNDICECLATYHFRRVPVTENGKLVGIVSRRDILRHIIHSRLAVVSGRAQA